MVYVRRINPEDGMKRIFNGLSDRVQSLETRPSGNIVVRETLKTTDPLTGVDTILGQLPDGTWGLAEFVNDVEPPGMPSDPIAYPSFGGVVIEWDGLDVNAFEKPKDFSRTEIHYRKKNDSDWLVGGVLYDATALMVPNLEIGTIYEFSLVSFDANNNESQRSNLVEGIPSGVLDNSDVSDAIEEIRLESEKAAQDSAAAQEAATAAQEAAAEAAADALRASNLAADKSSIVYSDTAPVDSNPANPTTLWIDTSGNPAKNTPNRWNGTNWVEISDSKVVSAAADAAAARASADLAAESAQRALESSGEALSSANGKNKIVYSSSPAPTGTVSGANAGDTWFQKDVNSIITGHWTYSGSAYTKATLGNDILAPNIDAGKITVGELNGALIKAKSILTDKLIISSSDNVIQEPDFTAGGISWGRSTSITYVASVGRGGGNVLRFTGSNAAQISINNQPKIAVDPESSYKGLMWVKSTAALPVGRVKLMMRCFTSTTAFTDVEIASNTKVLVSNTWTSVEGASTVGYGKAPTGTVNVQFYISVQNTATSDVTDISYVSAIRKADASLVVDGAIDGKIITGALIQSRADTNRGIKLSDTQFVAYNNDGTEALRLDGTNSILTGAVYRTGASGPRVQIDKDGVVAHGVAKVQYPGETTSREHQVRTIIAARQSKWGADANDKWPGLWFESNPTSGTYTAPLFPAGFTTAGDDAYGVLGRSAVVSAQSGYSEMLLSPFNSGFISYGPPRENHSPGSELTVYSSGFRLSSFGLSSSLSIAGISHTGDGILRLAGEKGVLINGAPVTGGPVITEFTATGYKNKADANNQEISKPVTNFAGSTGYIATSIGNGAITVNETGVYACDFQIAYFWDAGLTTSLPVSARTLIDIADSNNKAFVRTGVQVEEDQGTAAMSGKYLNAGDMLKFRTYVQTSQAYAYYRATIRITKLA